ncbi:MAG: tRNA uridine-5-carboxymethylaminomethyl(34) synthesis GTPase MnmE [Bdellovibrionales bacterium]|nr:tRNA uridine-5-carboxymethylaminomethyl(34) synthesis GTPase MnmE [Bdellovibrionales bacterium]NQZ17667.1 tRNA uridine-5-carboxymethylaminomethyl(34) synthesis GTPase MnmE [Bdellovibrionales bacterium]
MIQYVNLVDDTICSPITAPGYSGVAVVRVSGQQALQMTQKACPSLPDKPESHKVYLSSFKNDDQNIDQVLVSYFKKGSSFTGDEVVEISCHGSPLLTNAIVNEYLNMGCRNAEKGEFSFRAFYNGKIDLVQAESIQTLITSNNTSASTESLKQLDGDLSETFKKLEDDLVLAISHLEATIDFVEQDIDPQDYKAVNNRLENILTDNEKLIESYHIGKNLLKCFQVLLVGETNVGKSSLFNQLFKQEKAIVTDISGTTRDLISAETFLGNLSVEFTDSAGLRESSDKVESIGIQKTLEKVDNSQALLVVIDALEPVNFEIVKKLPMDKSFFVFNKMDQVEDLALFLQKTHMSFKEQGLSLDESKSFFISALTGEGVDDLKKGISRGIQNQSSSYDGVLITQTRHFNHLSQLKVYLQQARQLIEIEESPDLISQELQHGLMEIQKLLGKEYDDQILDKIFSEFCIGK